MLIDNLLAASSLDSHLQRSFLDLPSEEQREIIQVLLKRAPMNNLAHNQLLLIAAHFAAIKTAPSKAIIINLAKERKKRNVIALPGQRPDPRPWPAVTVPDSRTGGQHRDDQ